MCIVSFTLMWNLKCKTKHRMAYKLMKCPKNNSFAFDLEYPLYQIKRNTILGNNPDQHKTTYPIISTVKM